ncbi:hypothetical protein Q1695_007347 [Nippostrongylus brasiliensis]|nr:hypothetical protein Q1695_007347 [Nippostrongylus brasiliensis]
MFSFIVHSSLLQFSFVFLGGSSQVLLSSLISSVLIAPTFGNTTHSGSTEFCNTEPGSDDLSNGRPCVVTTLQQSNGTDCQPHNFTIGYSKNDPGCMIQADKASCVCPKASMLECFRDLTDTKTDEDVSPHELHYNYNNTYNYNYNNTYNYNNNNYTYTYNYNYNYTYNYNYYYNDNYNNNYKYYNNNYNNNNYYYNYNNYHNYYHNNNNYYNNHNNNNYNNHNHNYNNYHNYYNYGHSLY